jgi:carboxyl-terminal processing protease
MIPTTRLFLVRLSLLFLIVCLPAQAKESLADKVAAVNNESITVSQLPPLSPTEQQASAANLVKSLLSFYHYRRDLKFNDEFSREVLAELLKQLDPAKVYLLASDIASFEAYADKLDDALVRKHLEPAFDIFAVFRARWVQRYNYALKLLDGEFDFNLDESFDFDREKAPWPASRTAMNEIWRKRVKNDELNLLLAGKTVDEARDLLRKRYHVALRRMAQTGSNDVFRYFMSAVTAAIDPHTTYFSPRNAENFNIEMSLSLEGIGAVLQSEDVYTKVVRLVPAGPADRSGQIRPGDMIVGVGQGDEEIEDVIGWRLDDVVDKIRGKAGTKVVLEVLPKGAGPDAPTKKVEIVREKIKLEDQEAKKKVLTVQVDGKPFKYGVIELPIFYIDFEAYYRGDKNYKSTTRDVRKLVNELKEQGVQGIVVDLRNNGGGSLAEATQLSGLFIDKGPIVLEEDSRRKVEALQDEDAGVAWDGPMVVLVNRMSASASEIFAAAMQDYGRALVIGQTTFGKGTVQQIQDLDRWNTDPDKGSFGQLKFTVARFYRVNGESTQIKGVIPDIALPEVIDPEDIGEAALDNALPWAHIKPAAYRPTPLRVDVGWLQQRSQNRVGRSAAFQLVKREVDLYKAYQKESAVSLNMAKRKAEREKAKKEELALLNAKRELLGMPPVQKIEDHDETDDKSMDNFDPWLDESGHILSDLIHAKKAKVVSSEDKAA